MSWYGYGAPSPDFVRDPLAGWNHVSGDVLAASDLHPSQLAAPRLEYGPYEAAAKKRSWDIPIEPHPLSLLLAQLARPKFCSSLRWAESGLLAVKLFSAVDGAPLGTIGSIYVDAVRKLSSTSPFGLGSQTVYDDAVRRGEEVRASQLQIALLQRLYHGESARYFSDIAFQVGRYLFPGAHEIKLVLHKLAMYTEGGHFKMHKDTTHADSHVGTVLIGCGVTDNDNPSDEDLLALHEDFIQDRNDVPGYTPYTGGDIVILNDEGKEQRYKIQPAQVLAFSTDVLHAVDVVTSGVKITLQFDVYIEDESVQRDNTVSCVDLRTWREFYGLRPHDAPGADSSGAETSAPAACSSCQHPGCVLLEANRPIPEPETWPPRVVFFNALDDDWRSPRLGHSLAHWSAMDKNDERYPMETFDDAVDRFVVHLLALLREVPGAGDSVAPPEHTAVSSWPSSRRKETENQTTSPPRTVAFLLSHMYRKRSIRPEYLKGVDAAIYHALAASQQLRIILHYVTFEVAQVVRYRIERQRLAICPPYDTGVSPQEIPEPVLVLNRPGSDSTFLFTEQDGRVAHGELYVGNEALEQPFWYVAGAMFVSLL